MIEVKKAYADRNLDFARCAVAITSKDSKLDKQAKSESWLATFPMYDWVGGRTSEMSAVGLVPAALQGIDICAILGWCKRNGRRHPDASDQRQPSCSVSAKLVLCWQWAWRKRHGCSAL